MAYSINLDRMDNYRGCGFGWPRVYEFGEWHTQKVTKYEFKDQADLDSQCENDPEVMRLFKHYKTIKLGVKK